MNSRTPARRPRARAAASVLVLVVAATGLGSPSRSDAAPTEPTPPAECGPGSDPETAEQGRVPRTDYDSGRVDRPYTCNTELISHVAGTGGFKVHRHVDEAGRECAYYDTNLVIGNELLTQIQTETPGLGVAVVDMTDPTHPVHTASLTTPAMLSPHESLEIHNQRGLLVAAMGTAATLPAFVDVYDVSKDCRSPRLLSSTPIGLLGHESALSPDGNTFYVSATAFNLIAAIDLSDPSRPTPITYANLNSHGMNVSDDGTRLYTTPLDVGAQLLPSNDGTLETGLAIIDVSAVQERQGLLSDVFDGDGLSLPDLESGILPPMPTVSEVVFPDGTIAQTAIPVTIDGNPYLITIDEFVDFVDFLDPLHAPPGIGRIFDISDETEPDLVSTLELEVHQADIRPGLAGDPGADLGFQSYAGHYCAVPQRPRRSSRNATRSGTPTSPAACGRFGSPTTCGTLRDWNSRSRRLPRLRLRRAPHRPAISRPREPDDPAS